MLEETEIKIIKGNLSEEGDGAINVADLCTVASLNLNSYRSNTSNKHYNIDGAATERKMIRHSITTDP